MNATQSPAHEPLHLTVLRGIIFIGAALLFVSPLASLAGTVAAVLAVPVALYLSRLSFVARLRGPVLAAGVLALFVVGLSAEFCLGRPVWISSLLGFPLTMALIGIVKFGTITLGSVFGLRMLAVRWPVFRMLEVAVVAATVVYLFAGHRDSQIGQPRSLADWAFSRGHNPSVIVGGIGLITLGAVVLMLMRRQTWQRTLGSIALLLLLLLFGYGLFRAYVPEYPSSSTDEETNPSAQLSKEKLTFDGKKWPQNPKDIAIVSLHADYDPIERSIYFIEAAFSEYNGKKMARTEDGSFDQDVPRNFPKQRTEIGGDTKPVGSSLEVPMTISLIAELKSPFGIPSVRVLEPRPNANPKNFVLTYAATSRALQLSYMELAKHRAGDPSWSEAVRTHYLAYPKDPRYRELAEKIVAEGVMKDQRLKSEYQGSAVFRALAIRRYIEKNMTYSLKVNHEDKPDPTAAYLFEEKKGYCVHSAHAMCYLLRALGIPARVAGGYMVPGNRRGTGSSILILESDGHAWCEVYLQGLGWVVMDASPENSDEPAPPSPDAAKQNYLGQENRKERDQEWYGQDDDPTDEPKVTPVAWPWKLLLVIVLMLDVLYGVKVWRVLVPRFAAETKLYRLSYRASLDHLAEVGLTRQFGETREEFARRLAQVTPRFVELTQAHERRAIGVADKADRTTWLGLQRQVETGIVKGVPAKRRVLGTLNPVSWLAVR